jgi:hypothetical protein
MIDTLKLSKRLQQANLPAAQAEALAEGLAESLKESYVSKEFLQAELMRLKTELIVWMVGTVGLGTLINHWWR